MAGGGGSGDVLKLIEELKVFCAAIAFNASEGFQRQCISWAANPLLAISRLRRCRAATSDECWDKEEGGGRRGKRDARGGRREEKGQRKGGGRREEGGSEE